MEHTLEIIGTVVGILYLWLEYRASIYLWIAGIIMPAVYIFVYYDAGLYADFGINIYYLGAAIPTDSIPHIFERFYRADASRSREVPGTGLGLSIVKHICEIHGAVISVTSEFDNTVFTVQWPSNPEVMM